MNLGMITLSLCMVIKKNYAIQILIALLCILKQKIFTEILLMMLKDCLILRVIIKKMIDLPICENKVIGMFKDEL